MSYNVSTIAPFDKQLKKLSKKYPSLKIEFASLIEILEKDPIQGVSLGNNCYKIRLSIASKGKGKSGGARVITNIVVDKKNVYLLSIYDKSKKDNITDIELSMLLDNI
jgi:mRNA-degrading endonuclease RelE of RelBE toxin-antitoxin system